MSPIGEVVGRKFIHDGTEAQILLKNVEREEAEAESRLEYDESEESVEAESSLEED